jgi:hypothetical protein
VPPLVTVVGRYFPSGEAVKRNLAVRRSSRRLDLPILLIDWHAYNLGHGRRRLGFLRRAESQVIEDLLDGDGVVEVGNDLEPSPRTVEERGMFPRVGM